jgi:hypothetical protein
MVPELLSGTCRFISVFVSVPDSEPTDPKAPSIRSVTAVPSTDPVKAICSDRVVVALFSGMAVMSKDPDRLEPVFVSSTMATPSLAVPTHTCGVEMPSTTPAENGDEVPVSDLDWFM